MSSIVKALRKLEEEKRRGKLESPDLRVDQGQSAPVGKSILPVVAGIVCGAAIVGLFFLWPAGHVRKRDALQSDSTASVTPVVTPQLATVAPPVPETAEALQDRSVPAKPETPVTDAVSKPAAMPVMRAPNSVTATSSGPRRESTGLVAPDTAAPVEPAMTVVQNSVPGESMALPESINLVVTEIFYQGGVNSMAVVNDLPVMVGSHIDSAVVTAIHVDRVLFEINGKVYPVPAAQ